MVKKLIKLVLFYNTESIYFQYVHIIVDIAGYILQNQKNIDMHILYSDNKHKG